MQNPLKTLAMRWSNGPTSGYRWGGVGSRELDWNRVGDGTDSSVVMAPLLWVQRTFPEAPLVLDRRTGGDWELQPDHPLPDLVRQPNPYYSGELLWMATVASLLVDGNAYWVKLTDSQFRVTQLWWVPPSLIEPKWNKDGTEFITHYAYKPSASVDPVVLLPSEVVHFRWGIDPDNQRKGKSPLRSVLSEVFADDEAERFGAGLLANMGVPGLIVSPADDSQIPDEELEAVKLKLAGSFTGARRGMPFVANSKTQVSMFGFNPKQMDLRDLRRVPEERVTAVLGVPAIVAGLGAGLDRSTFANYAEAREAAYESCIVPLQRIISSEVGLQLVPDFESDPKLIRVRFDISEVRVLMEDQNKLVERKLKELDSGAITLEEYRKETGRQVDDTHKIYLRRSGLDEVPEAELGAPKETPPLLQPFAGQNPPPPAGGADPTAVDPNALPKRRHTKGTRQQDRYMDEVDYVLARLSKQFQHRLEVVFEKLGDDLAKLFLEHEPKRRKAAPQPNEPDIVGTVDRLVRAIQLHEFASSELVPTVQDHYGRITVELARLVEHTFDVPVNLPDPVMRKVLSTGGTRAGLIDLSSSTRDALLRAITDGRVLGEGPVDIAKRIRSEVPAGRYVNAGSKYRAMLIARTETKYAQNVASIAVYKAAGAETCTAYDNQTGYGDPDCVERDGKEFPISQVELELGDEHPNGTLSFAPNF